MDLLLRNFQENYLQKIIMNTTSILRNIVRAAGLFTLLMRLASWSIISTPIPGRIFVSIIIVLVTMLRGNQEVRSGITFALAAMTVAWAIGFGFSQGNLLPNEQWLTPVMHLFSGVATLGLAEMVAACMEEAQGEFAEVLGV